MSRQRHLAAIAARLGSDYLLCMRRPLPRRWFALFAVMALILSLTAHGVLAADMGTKMMSTAAAGEMAPSGMCKGCGGGDDGMPVAACYSLCGGIVAVLPDFVLISMATVEATIPSAVPSHLGRDGPPDPYPPKSSILI